MKQRLAASQAESNHILEQAQLSHKLVVQGLQRKLHDALEGRTAAEGELTYNFRLRSLQCMLVKVPTHQFRTSSNGHLS